MTEKIMIVDTGFAGTKITTVDGTKRNLVKTYELDDHSFYEIAKRVYKRFKEDKYNRIIVDAYGAGAGLLDQLIPLFEKDGYAYDSKTGRISMVATSITFGEAGMGITINSGSVGWSKIASEEF